MSIKTLEWNFNHDHGDWGSPGSRWCWYSIRMTEDGLFRVKVVDDDAPADAGSGHLQSLKDAQAWCFAVENGLEAKAS